MNIELTPFQVEYLKALVEQDFDAKGLAYCGYAKRFIRDKIMLEALINLFERKLRKTIDK